MVLVVESITNKTGKILTPTIVESVGDSRLLPSGNTWDHVIHGSYLRIVQWILKIPLGILSYTLRIIQQSSPEGGPKDPRIHTGVYGLPWRVNKKGPN